MNKYIEHITFLALLFLAGTYFLERTVFVDMAYHIFAILKNNNICIQNHRVGAAFTQSFPYLLSQVHAPLKFICFAYSISFIILQYGSYCFIRHVLKNKQLALVVFLFSTLIVTHTFFWVQSELPQGVMWMLVYFGLFHNEIKSKLFQKHKTPAYLALLVVIAFTHPLLVFPMFFIYIFLWLHIGKSWEKPIAIHAIGFIILCAIKIIFYNTSYENQALGGLSNIIKKFPNYIQLQSNIDFVMACMTQYQFLIFGFFMILAFYWNQNKLKKAVLVFSSFIGYLFMVNISHADGAEIFYIENQYLVLSIFIAVPFSFDLWPYLSKYKWRQIIPILISIACVLRIVLVSSNYTDRLDWLIAETDKMENNNTKRIVSKSQIPKDKVKMTWALHYESWLLSSMNHTSSQTIIVEEQEGEFDRGLKTNDKFLTIWGDSKYNEISPLYFKFDDSYYIKSK